MSESTKPKSRPAPSAGSLRPPGAENWVDDLISDRPPQADVGSMHRAARGQIESDILPSDLPGPDSPSEQPTDLPPPPALPAEIAGSSLTELDQLAAMNRWARMVELLGPPPRAQNLPSAARLLYHFAQREGASPGASQSSDGMPLVDVDTALQTALAELLGLAPQATLPHLLAKRLARRELVRMPAPPPRTSFLLVVLAIVAGAFLGAVLVYGRTLFKM